MPNDKIVLGKAYQNIGYAFWRSGNLDSAMLNIQKAYSIHKPINHYDGLINELGTFAQYYTIKNQYARSIEYLNESLRYSNKIGHAETQCRTSILLSENYAKLNDLVNAKKYADSAVVIADRTQLKNLQKSAYDNVAKLSAAQADYEKAYKVKVIADSIQTKIIKGQNIEHAQELDIKYEVKEKQNIITEQKAAIKTHKSLNILLFILGAISLIGGYFIYTYINKQAQNAKLKAQQLAMQLNEVWLKYEQLYENQSIETRGVLVENEQSTPIYLDSNEQQQEKIIQQHSENNTYIEFKEDREIKKIAYTAIYYIKSGKNYQEFFDKSDKRIGMILLPLSNLHQLLPENFCRVQKSYIVNKNYLAEKKIIKRGKKEFVILSNDVEIPFSDKFDEIDGFPLL